VNVRVIVQHTPRVYALLGLWNETACWPSLRFESNEGVWEDYDRVTATPRWVLYRRRGLWAQKLAGAI